MNITLRRHYRLIIALILVIGICIIFGSVRIISYNFGEGQDIQITGKNYDNESYLFDDSLVHEIQIGLNQEDYDDMVRLYQETGEKDFYRTYVTIDGVTIPDVGVRLKGNLTLRQTLGGTGNGQNMPGPMGNRDDENNQDDRPNFGNRMPNIENIIQRGLPPGLETPDNWDEMTDTEKATYIQENIAAGFRNNINGPGGMNPDGNGGNPPFLIKFDEFISGQSYQGLAEIAVRLGSDQSLLGEPVAFYIHRELGQIVPETAYAVVTTAENEPSLYVICEHLDEKYVEKYFPGSDGILYKAGNFIGFNYQGEDPTLYSEVFEQKTSINDDDLAPLIRFLKFVDESSDKEFAAKLSDWLDIDSFIRMMALDNLLSNNDSFTGMGSNYYLYFDKSTEQFTMLSWDLNLAMGGMGGRRRQEKNDDEEASANTQQQQEIFEKWLQEGGFGVDNRDQLQQDNQAGNQFRNSRHSQNILKERFFANGNFSQMYETEYARLEEKIFHENWVLDKITALPQVFTDYNSNHHVLDQEEYNTGIAKITDYVEKGEVSNASFGF